MTPFVGLSFGGATLVEPDDLAPGKGLVGRPVWGPAALLANLELRLGLPSIEGTEPVRIQRWSRRMGEVASTSTLFYSDAYAVDPIGTARALLSWRDMLLDAGWNGDSIADGGERLEALHELERGADVPPGRPDRLRAVERELLARRIRPFERVDLADPIDVWPGRWRRVFVLLESVGTYVRTIEPGLSPTNANTDLGRLQSLLRGDDVGRPEQLTGDGSLILLRAETSWELGHAVAALLHAWGDPNSAIIRGGELRPLDFALTARGFPSQGIASVSKWRPVLQILPLAVELAFEPRDPYRVLELLTLPVGPFAGMIGNRLASALAESPGIGGRAWRFAKESLEKNFIERARRVAAEAGADQETAAVSARADITDRFARLAEWIEAPGHDPVRGAPRAALLAVADRVRAWLRNHVVALQSSAGERGSDTVFERKIGVISAALFQVKAFHEALSHDPREVLDAVAARQLLDDISSSGETVILEIERSSRIDPVDSPGGLRCPRSTVMWWHCVGGTEWRPSTRPWRHEEIEALCRADVCLVDPARRLAVEASGWRRAILATQDRLVLAMPRWSEGLELEPHPIWDEIVARFNAHSADVARVTLDVRDALEGRALRPLGAALESSVETVPPAALPEARERWTLDAALLPAANKHSASSIEALIGCPFQWVLSYRAGLRPESIVSIPAEPVLNGQLGHRLVEELHGAGALSNPEQVALVVDEVLERLIREEAAVLLRAGRAFERAQLRKQLVRSVTALSELLAASNLTVDAVESTTVIQSGTRRLEGRLDLLLRDQQGDDVVLDLKWGASRYRDLLATGTAVQLATYAAVRQLVTGAPRLPSAAYFSLSRGELFTTEVGRFATRALDGPVLSDTWSRVQRTVELMEKTLAGGDVPVAGVRRSLPLLELVDVPESERCRHLELPQDAACKYCAHPALCGRAWEGFQ